MDETRKTDEAPALRAGRLEGVSLPDLLWSLCRRSTTGVLSLSRPGTVKTIYIEDGRIVFASSSDPDDRLGELFLKRGSITLDQLEEALRSAQTGKRLGTLLVEAGSLRPEELVDGVLSQVRSIVLDLFAWAEGEYRFDEGPLPTAEVIKLGIGTPELLLSGIRGVRSFSRIRRSVGGPHQTYGLAAGAAGLLDGLRLSSGEELLIERLREREETVENLCREVFVSNFEIYQALWGLKILGIVEEREARPGEASETAFEGELGQVGFGELLVRLGRERLTGVLHLSRHEAERTFHIQDGRCVFATSSVPDDGLVAYLLRRGVISLRDREETAKRLLSNKRVGTILRELGVIDDDDLREMVRQQISEIVYETFRWEDAHFAFVVGPLPSNEEITLRENLNRLVAAGVRRVTSWSRVQRGCGGLDTPLALLPTYLDVLDAMDAGPEEWEVLTALKTVTTPRRICRDSALGAFRICQVLWILRVLGAVESRPAAELPAEGAAQPLQAPPVTGPRTIEVVDLDRAPVVEESPVTVAVEPPDLPLDETPPAGPDEADRVTPEWVTEPEPVAASAGPPEEPVASPEPAPDREDRNASEPAGPGESVALWAGPGLEERPPDDQDEEKEEKEEGEENEGAFDRDRFAGETQILSRAVVEASLRNGQGEETPAEPPKHDTTQVIPREVVDRALLAAENAEPAGGSEEGPDFEPPDDLDRTIARFNTIQRLVYRTVRSEVGAGAVNFIRACCGHLDPETVESLQGADLQPDGSWDTEALRRAVLSGRIEDPWTEYRKLIDIEIELLRQHIGEARAVELERQVARSLSQ